MLRLSVLDQRTRAVHGDGSGLNMPSDKIHSTDVSHDGERGGVRDNRTSAPTFMEVSVVEIPPDEATRMQLLDDVQSQVAQMRTGENTKRRRAGGRDAEQDGHRRKQTRLR